MYPITKTVHVDPEADYVDYLKRATRTTGESCMQVHNKLLSKLTAESYGVRNTENLKLLNLIQQADMEKADESLRCKSDRDATK